MDGNRNCIHSTQISLPAAAVLHGVAVQMFAPETLLRNSDPIVMAGYGSEVARHQNVFPGGPAAPQESDDAIFAIVNLHPLKALRFEVEQVHRRLTAIEQVQFTDPVL